MYSESMTTKMLERKTKKLEKEVNLLRSFIIGYLGKDSEGEYKPEFVRRVLRAAAQEPKYEFKNGDSFLKHIRGK